ncbi:hypothetical protein GCM10010149_50300 [Nonomuraea roseoviolacea subsp. roseoviolacea]|uniref:DUF1453 family protein n=1 Tax=Nonomuraea roseoviolacea subsp. carminata TaxID=160689 RepID=A0ABT1KGW3_9ACTN|nr:hypothetical protein [Nonomuraea roseoviolacea]MCP2352852.1 hypothetical protein [Nonomuraea roseoviolacea subsp. carminata]
MTALLLSGTAMAGAVTGGADGAGRLPVFIGLFVVVVIVVTRMGGRELRPVKLLVLPIILLVAGLAPVLPLLPEVELHGIDYQLIVADLVVSVGLGVVRGFTVQIYPKPAAIWYRYGPVTVALWCLSIGLRFLIGGYGAGHAATALSTSAGVIFMLGLTLLCQNVVVIARRPTGAGAGG